MKTEQQVINFLVQYSFSTPLDEEMILSFCEKKFSHPIKIHKTPQKSPKIHLDTQLFLQWYENGLECPKIAKNGNSIIYIISTNHENAQIGAEITPEGFNKRTYSLPISQITLCSLSEEAKMNTALIHHKLQYNWKTQSLSRKYIPGNGDKIIWRSTDGSTQGIGVVREANSDQSIELYCYFIYPTKTTPGYIGYNGHESSILNMTDYIIEPMMENSCDLNGICCIRRLRSELAKVGKIWNDRLKRIEPINVKVKKGEAYWYISDKMKVVQETEKETPTSQFRYIAGNYFSNYKSALYYLKIIQGILNDFMASDSYPKIKKSE